MEYETDRMFQLVLQRIPVFRSVSKLGLGLRPTLESRMDSTSDSDSDSDSDSTSDSTSDSDSDSDSDTSTSKKGV